MHFPGRPAMQSGVLLDSHLLLKEAVIARMAFIQLCVVHQLYLFLDEEALCSVTDALVTFHVDYYNALKWGYPWKL